MNFSLSPVFDRPEARAALGVNPEGASEAIGAGMSLIDILDTVSNAFDIVTHPRFYIPLLGGIAVALGLWRWMPAGDGRDVLAGLSVAAGLIVGLVWDWGR